MNNYPQDSNGQQNPYEQPQRYQQPYQQNPFEQQYQSPYQQNPYQQMPSYVEEPGKGMATGSLVCSLVGIFFAGLILGIVGLALSISSINKNKAVGMKSNSLAVAGLVISIIDVVFGALYTFAIVIPMVAGIIASAG